MMSAPEVMPQTMQSFQYLNYAAQYQQQVNYSDLFGITDLERV
jgi:hypothetical protein